MPTAIMATGNRILVQAADQWQLFDTEGKALASGPLHVSEVVLDRAHELFYHNEPVGLIAARRLTDGGRLFLVAGYAGNNYRRAFLSRRGRKLIVASVEFVTNPHSNYFPNLSAVNVVDVGEPHEVDSLTGILRSARPLAELTRDISLLFAALHDETLYLATRDRVYLADLDLKIRAELAGQFEPVAMSLDEAGRIYLLVRAEGRTALWLLSPQGERLMAFTMPSDLKLTATPPIVGYNHRVYVLGADRMLAINPDGKLAWVRPVNGQRGGAVITADDQLLVSDGRDLAVFNQEGQRSVLSSFDNETLFTPPVLTASGEILVASERRLYLLAPKAEAAK
jgi:hypothetical protein